MKTIYILYNLRNLREVLYTDVLLKIDIAY